MKQLYLSAVFSASLGVLGALLFFSSPVSAYDGKLRVKCNVPAKVYINKIEIGKTGEVISGLPFGKCKVIVVAEGYKKYEQMVEILGNNVIEVEVTLKKKGDDTTDSDEETPSGEEESGEDEPGEKEEDPESSESVKEKPEDKKSQKYEIDDVRKASKKGDNDHLRDILSSDSDYLVRIVTAAALIRLKSKASIDFIHDEIDSKFSSAPTEWFDNSPFYGPSRTFADSISIADAFSAKKVKFDTFEKLVCGYAAVLSMKEKQAEYRKECRKLQRKMVSLKKNKPNGWWGQHSQCDHDIKRMSKDIKDYSTFVSRTLTIIKKRSRSKEDKDLAALTKYFHDHAKGKLKD